MHFNQLLLLHWIVVDIDRLKRNLVDRKSARGHSVCKIKYAAQNELQIGCYFIQSLFIFILVCFSEWLEKSHFLIELKFV